MSRIGIFLGILLVMLSATPVPTSSVRAQATLEGTYTPPPDRLTQAAKDNGFIQVNSCPPVKAKRNATPPPDLDPSSVMNLPPTHAKDQNVGGGSTKDHFMGDGSSHS